MAVISPAKLELISKGSASDPKQAIWDALGGAVDKLNPMGAWVLVATYIAPDHQVQMPGGGTRTLFIPSKSKDEDLYQGCVGLVLRKGKTAFVDDDLHLFHGQSVNVNDWVLFRFSSAWEIHLNGVSVRFVPDTEIKGTIEHPNLIASRPIPALGG